MSQKTLTAECSDITDQSPFAFSSTVDVDECSSGTQFSLTVLSDDADSPLVTDLGEYIVIG